MCCPVLNIEHMRAVCSLVDAHKFAGNDAESILAELVGGLDRNVVLPKICLCV